MKRGTVLWTLAALLGIGLTAGVTWGASLLFSQPIGLASQPASVIDTLAPRTNTTASTSSASTTKKPTPAVNSTHTTTTVTKTVAPVVTRVTTTSTVTTASSAPVVTHTVTAPRATGAPAATQTTTTGHATGQPGGHDDGGHRQRTSSGGQATRSGGRTQADD